MKNHMAVFWFIRFHRAKVLCIRFDKVKVFIRVYNWTRYSTLYGPWKKKAIYNKNKYLKCQKRRVTCTIYYTCSRIKIALHDSLRLEKISTLLNIMNSLSQVLIKVKSSTTIIYHQKNARSQFSLPDCSWGKKVIIIGADISSSVHVDKKTCISLFSKV